MDESMYESTVPPKPPSMAELIDDFGLQTREVCVACLSKRRFNALVKLRASDKIGDWWLVCPYCDTARA